MKLARLASYVKEHGVRESVILTADRVLGRRIPEITYDQWMSRSRPSSGDYRRMEKTKLPYSPMIGVKASMPEKDRIAFMQSLNMQVYDRFQALVNSPDAEYYLIVEGACTLRPDLLWQCVSLLNDKSSGQADLIYFDSDRIGPDGRRCQPAFRPEYDPELLARVNYMGNVVLVRAKAALDAGLPAGGRDAFWSFLKRICFGDAQNPHPAGRIRVRHIPKVLYHLDGVDSSFSPGEVPASAVILGGGLQMACSDQDTAPGRQEEPLISILIPNRDHAQDLKRCVESLLTGNTWKNFEILILENQSSSEETFSLYRQLTETDSRIRVLEWDRPFNYSAINNFGADHAGGEYLLLLNNDTQILEGDSLARMQALCALPETGAVGALLLYPDGSVQHGGIILGHGGIAGHAWTGEKPECSADPFPWMVFSHTHNVSAVTGACMMLRKTVWQKVGGMDESLAVTFNDVDLCMRIRAEGLKVLMCPGACLIHDESASRGSEDSAQKVERFHREIRIFVHRWEKELEQGDPFYNPCLTLTGRSWTCRDELRESARPYLKYLDL